MFLCFIDHEKAFEKIRHKEPMKMLEGLDNEGKELRLMRNIHGNQSCSEGAEGAGRENRILHHKKRSKA